MLLLRTLIVLVLVLAAVVATSAAIAVAPHKGTVTQKSNVIGGPDGARIADAR